LKFQTRLLFTYSVLVFFLTVVLGITFYTYTSRLFENNEAVHTINFNLLTYSILKNFYCVVVISQAGDFFSSNFINHSQIHFQGPPFSQLPGYTAAEVKPPDGVAFSDSGSRAEALVGSGRWHLECRWSGPERPAG